MYLIYISEEREKGLAFNIFMCFSTSPFPLFSACVFSLAVVLKDDDEDRSRPGFSYEKRDKSVFMRRNEKGIVDDVMLTQNKNGHKAVKVRVRSVRVPQVRDQKRVGRQGSGGDGVAAAVGSL